MRLTTTMQCNLGGSNRGMGVFWHEMIPTLQSTQFSGKCEPHAVVMLFCFIA